MKVVFLENVEGTAQIGEIKEVKNGFARNYLLPQGLAAPAIEPYLQRAQGRAIKEAKRQEALDGDARGLAERIEGTRISVTARVGEHGKLYGSITSVRIAEEVAQIIGAEFDHRKVLLPEAIKEVGVQPVRLRLTRNVEAAIELEVLAEGEPEAPIEDEEAGDAEATAEDTEDGAEAPSAEAGEVAADTEDVSEAPPAEAEEIAEASADASEAEPEKKLEDGGRHPQAPLPREGEG